MDMGVGVLASMAYENKDHEDLKALDAKGLFPQVTTWLGFPRDRVLRGYMMDFIKLFAPHYSEHMIRDAAALETQALVDSFVSGLSLPEKSEREDDTAVN